MNFILLIGSSFITLFLGDNFLGMLGFPSEFIEDVYPSYMKKIIKNIEFEYEFKTNNQGLRYKNIPFRKPKETSRIFVVGDSFTEGVGVKSEETFCSFLEKEFSASARKVNFINGGIGGTYPLIYGQIFSTIGIRYQPEGLLICIYTNDVANTPPGFFSNYFNLEKSRRSVSGRYFHLFLPRVYVILRKFKVWYVRTRHGDFIEDTSKDALKRGIPVERIEEWKKQLPKELVEAVNRKQFNNTPFYYGLVDGGHWTRSIDVDSEFTKQQAMTMLIVLSEIIAKARKLNMEVGVIYIPTPLQYDSSIWEYQGINLWQRSGVNVRKEWLSEETQIQRELKYWAYIEKVPFLDLTPVFRQAVKTGSGPLNYKLDGHLNAQGHRVAGEVIAEWLRKDNVFSSINAKDVVGKK